MPDWPSECDSRERKERRANYFRCYVTMAEPHKEAPEPNWELSHPVPAGCCEEEEEEEGGGEGEGKEKSLGQV